MFTEKARLHFSLRAPKGVQHLNRYVPDYDSLIRDPGNSTQNRVQRELLQQELSANRSRYLLQSLYG